MAIFTAIAGFLLAGTVFAGTVAVPLLAAGLGIAASVGLSYAAQALAGKPQNTDTGTAADNFSVQVDLQMGGNVPRSFNVGYSMTAGSRTYANQWGNDGQTPNAYFTDVIALEDMPGGRLLGVWVDGTKCTLGPTPHPDFGYPVVEYNKDGKDHLWVKYYDGTQTTADTFLVTKVSSADRPFEATRVYTGVSYAVCTALVNNTLFTSTPQFKFELSGIPLYDPTKDSTNGGTGSHRWSDPSTWGGDGDDLPAVQAYNIMRGVYYNGTWLYGLQGMTAARLPTLNWNVQIAKCREEIERASGAMEPTYRTGGQINVNAQIGNTIEALLTGCQGKISEIGGFYKVRVGSPDSPSFAFTDDDIIDSEEQHFAPFFGLADSINGIQGTYPDPAQGWNTATAPPLYDTGYEAQDGDRRLVASPAFDFVPYPEQVQQLQKSALQEARRERRHTLVFGPAFWIVEPGDVGTWTSVRNGYDEKLFRVDGAIDHADLNNTFDLTETDPTDYSWDKGEFRPPTTGQTTYPRPAPQGIVGWDAEPDTIEDNDGLKRRPGIRLIWDGDMPGVDGVQYEVRLAGKTDVISRGSTNQLSAGAERISASLLPETAYEVRGQYLPSAPRDMLWSDWIAVTTPDVKLSAIDFENGLKDLVTNYFGQTTDQINSVLQTISAVIAQQAGTNQNDKQQIINRLVATAGRLGASIDQVSTVAVDTQSALAQFQIAATAMIDEHTASIEQTQSAIATIDGQLATSWAIKADVNNYITSIELLNDGTTSAFVIMADIFKIVFPGLTPQDVFQIANVNGVPQAVLRADMLFDGMVTARSISVSSLTAITTHFGDAQIDGKLTMGPGGKLVIDGYIGAIMGFRVP